MTAPRSRPLGGRSKRILDVVVASAALLCLLPLIVMVAALVRVTMGSPVIFAHERIGHRQRIFRCYKFRTMVRDPDAVLEKLLLADADAAKEWFEKQKLTCDPRVTPVGRFLRKTSLDELPQLLNVIRGDMSCVGPRPVIEPELLRYGQAAELYVAARPGITGMWQISGRSIVDYPRRVALDREYLENWSVWLDLSILARTMVAVFRFEESA